MIFFFKSQRTSPCLSWCELHTPAHSRTLLQASHPRTLPHTPHTGCPRSLPDTRHQGAPQLHTQPHVQRRSQGQPPGLLLCRTLDLGGGSAPSSSGFHLPETQVCTRVFSTSDAISKLLKHFTLVACNSDLSACFSSPERPCQSSKPARLSWGRGSWELERRQQESGQ